MCLGEIGQVVQVWDEGDVRMARVRTADAELGVSLLYLPEARPGSHVLVHLGFALEELDAGEAAAAVALRRGEAEEGSP